MDYEVGDIVKLKNSIRAGSKEWRILRVGADFRLECMGCSHQIMIPRKQVEKKIPGLRKKGVGVVNVQMNDSPKALLRALRRIRSFAIMHTLEASTL